MVFTNIEKEVFQNSINQSVDPTLYLDDQELRNMYILFSNISYR